MARVWAGKTPNKAALIDSGRVVSYTELNERSNRVANELARTGIRPGYHVGFLGKDSSAFFEIWLGVNKAGCALTSLSLRSAPAELVEVVQDANIPLIFAGRDFAEFAERVRQAADITMEIVAEDELDHWSSDAGVADHDVVLTDGEETCGRSPCELGKELHAEAAQLTINVIGLRVKGFSWTGEQSILEARCLAEQNGGAYIPVETEDELAAAFEKTLGCPMISQGAIP